MYASIETLSRHLERIAKAIIGIAFFLMVIAILVSVFTRNFNISVTWLEELARYLQVWFVGIGFAVALRKGQLAGTEVVLKKLQPRVAKIVVLINKVVMLGVSVLMLVTGRHLIGHTLTTRQLSANLQIPIVFAYLGLYLAFVFAVFFIVSSIITGLRGEKDELDLTFEPASELDDATPLRKEEIDRMIGNPTGGVSEKGGDA